MYGLDGVPDLVFCRIFVDDLQKWLPWEPCLRRPPGKGRKQLPTNNREGATGFTDLGDASGLNVLYPVQTVS